MTSNRIDRLFSSWDFRVLLPRRRVGLALACLAILSVSTSLLAGQHSEGHDTRALHEDPRLTDGQIAPLLVGLGSGHLAVTTSSPRAQLFFDQGLRLAYGFNHREALRAFKEAARLDPGCAMAYWGWALVLGPNLNLPMQAEAVPQAYEAIQKALSRINGVSVKEQDWIRALAKRYSDTPASDRSSLDEAYAAAMADLHRKYPEDPDVATLYAASLMNLSPWNYWTPDGKPREHTEEILETLRSTIELYPQHEGALHYFIHAVEAAHPEWGEAAADALRGRAPGAGHLTHMPSHIYMQLGRYSDAFEVNQLASLADEGYITQCRAQGIYPLGYYPHNIHFQVWAGMMLGRSREVLAISRKAAANVPVHFDVDQWALYETFLSLPLYTMVRFGMWDEILAEPRPPRERRFWLGISHYARGLAHVAGRRTSEAESELAGLSAIVDDPTTAEVLVGFSNAGSVLEIARETLAGELAGARKRHDEAIAHLERAVRLQNGLGYNEPPEWYYPARHNLGAALLDAGRPKEAETIYWQDLRRYPENPYSLLGLAQSLHAQGREQEATEIHERFERAWAHADVDISSSRW
jgi:tetratricopeptide (TPR) repeat protein